jgi:hypothetical protein
MTYGRNWPDWLPALVLVLSVSGCDIGGDSARTTTPPASSASDATSAPAVTYHASDPALLAATGRPQLVEFYHRL